MAWIIEKCPGGAPITSTPPPGTIIHQQAANKGTGDPECWVFIYFGTVRSDALDYKRRSVGSGVFPVVRNLMFGNPFNHAKGPLFWQTSADITDHYSDFHYPPEEEKE